MQKKKNQNKTWEDEYRDEKKIYESLRRKLEMNEYEE